jgi:hypothetical protein
VWLMLNMIDAKVPGHYMFHRMEEMGGQGSRWAASTMKNLLRTFSYAIAFDRRGRSDIITHQGGQRCCSDEFANALAEQLNSLNKKFTYKPDDTGSFTDTKNYTHLIPECTNVSVGYFQQHGPREYMDLNHAKELREVLPLVKWDELPVKRDPKVKEAKPANEWYGGYGGYPHGYETMRSTVPSAKNTKEVEAVVSPVKPSVAEDELHYEDAEFLIRRYPHIAAQLLVDSGYTWQDVDDVLMDDYCERLQTASGA